MSHPSREEPGLMRVVSMTAAAQKLRWVAAVLASVTGLVSVPASALVGPAREAPELAPYVVMVVDRRDMSYCTASVIDRRTVLTAAHCVATPEKTSIYLPEGDGPGVFLETVDVAVHPGRAGDARPWAGSTG